jgi:4-amino-4-deoxy-L-arabinose transferase-like glycosyltransferase
MGTLVLLTALLAGLSLVAPLNHDEGQYLAATRLVAGWRPYLDFLHLQTPLQIYAIALFAALAGEQVLPVLRLVTALCGAGTLAVVYLAQRRLQVPVRLALLCALLLALSPPFLFGATVVRNDALPALLEAAALLAAVAALRDASARGASILWFLAGALLALAASAKISYLLPLAGMALFHLPRLLRLEVRGALAAAAGAALGLLPIVIARAAAPEAFDYGVFGYAMQAPFDWYASTGAAHRLTFPNKLWDVARILALGPAGAALAFLAIRRWRRRGKADEAEALLGLLILAGLAAFLLPTPTWPQYAVPLLPPLFVAFGVELSRRPPARRSLTAALLLAGLLGLNKPVEWLRGGGMTPIAATREAQWIGARMRASGAAGSIATLSPQIMLGSGFPLDRRFAAGPFVYRTGDRLPAAQQRRLNAISPATLGAFLDEAPPAAIVTGYESNSRGRDLDGPLRAYAEARGYRAERSSVGQATLYLAPSGRSE